MEAHFLKHACCALAGWAQGGAWGGGARRVPQSPITLAPARLSASPPPGSAATTPWPVHSDHCHPSTHFGHWQVRRRAAWTVEAGAGRLGAPSFGQPLAFQLHHSLVARPELVGQATQTAATRRGEPRRAHEPPSAFRMRTSCMRALRRAIGGRVNSRLRKGGRHRTPS